MTLDYVKLGMMINEKLKKIDQEENRNLWYIAKCIGIWQNQLSKILNGKIKRPHITTMRQFWKLLELPDFTVLYKE